MTTDTQRELEAALTAAQKTPTDDDAWERAESLAARLESPELVADAYRDALDGELSGDDALEIQRRAVSYHEEWFGEDPTRLSDVLGRTLELDPSSEWAFQKLTVVLTVAGKWEELLSLYDRTIEATESVERKKRLLREAYEAARDLADEANKAIDYLQALYELSPTEKRADALEKLLAKNERWLELIALWEERQDEFSGKQRAALQLRIAGAWLERLDKPRESLSAVTRMLEEGVANDEEGMALVEKVLVATSASTRVRTDALDLLRTRFESSEKPTEIIRVLELAIPLVGTTKRRALHREAGERQSVLGNNDAALDHYARLLSLEPHSAATQRAMRAEAQASGDYKLYAEGVASAAEVAKDVDRRVALLDDAAQCRLDHLGDEAGAIDLLQTALAQEGVSPAQVLTVGRKLNQLLGGERRSERLAVLEKMAAAESVPSSRRGLIGDLARLAESLGESDRALEAWARRRTDDPEDLEALEATIALLETEKRWEPLIDCLGERVKLSDRPSERRADLVRSAAIYADELDRKEEALRVWRRIQEEFGEDAETIAALSSLLSACKRWDEHTALLERTCTEQTGGLADRLAELGQTYLGELDNPEAALRCFRRAVGVEPKHEVARSGLATLLEIDEQRPAAAEALSRALRDTGDWAGFLALTEPRLVGATGAEQRRSILLEAADIHLQHTGEDGAALGYLARAFPLGPADRALEDQLVAVAERTGEWTTALESYRGAIAAVHGDAGAEMGLRLRAAKLVEERLGDQRTALTTYLSCCAIQPDRRAAVSAAIRLAIAGGEPHLAATAFIAYTDNTDQLDAALLANIGDPDGAAGLAAAATALLSAMSEAGLGGRNGAELAWQAVGWRRAAECDAAEIDSALENVVRLDPNRRDAWHALVELRREDASSDLYGPLRRLGELEPDNLDVVAEIAEVACEVLKSPDDRTEREQALTALYARASSAWRGTSPAAASRDPEASALWAIERLVAEYRGGGQPERSLDLLVEAARLPWSGGKSREMRLAAADLASRELGDVNAAMETYQSMLHRNATDAETRDRLATLYRDAGRLAELFALRAEELGLGPDAERRLELRLEMASLLSEIERTQGRVPILRANLEESPGDERSVDLLTRLLEESGRQKELADILTDQAERLEEPLPERASSLWSKTAQLAELDLSDPHRALSAYRKVAELSDDLTAIGAIARIYLELEQPLEAVPWLERMIPRSAREQQADLALTLADAHLKAEQGDRAIDALLRAVRTGDAPLPVRQRLAELYRNAEDWERLGDLINETVPIVYDKQYAAELAGEAGDIFIERLDAPERALPALERAVELNGDDRGLRLLLARSLRAAERTSDARDVLVALIAEFGRRRSKERAAAHVELAHVARAEGSTEEAVEQLELAARMDVDNPMMLRMVARMAREGGDLARAERSLRALLMIVRRKPPGSDIKAIGPSEVFYELAQISGDRGDDDKKEELLESALESAGGSDAETLRLCGTLVELDDVDRALEVLHARAKEASSPTKRATLLVAVAELLEAADNADTKTNDEKALGLRLEALPLEPDETSLVATRRLAKRLDKSAKLADILEETIETLKRDDDSSSAGRLLLELGDIAERDLGQDERAKDAYQQLQSLGGYDADALFALARVHGALGDREAQSKALDQLTEMANAGEDRPEKADALYRLAQMQVEESEMLERGLDLLERALDIEARYAQAGTTLRAASKTSPGDERVLKLWGPVARGAGDPALLLDFLEHKATQSGAEARDLKEAANVAFSQGQDERGEAILQRAIDASGGVGADDATWPLLAMAEHRLARNDLQRARDLIIEVADRADRERVMTLGLSIATRAAGAAETAPLAAEVYELLRQRDPAARNVWEPLFDVYLGLGDDARLDALVEETLPQLLELSERNMLRRKRASQLAADDRNADAAAILRDALLDDPNDLEAGTMLEAVYRASGDDAGLADFLWQRFEEAKELGNPETVASVALSLGSLLEQSDREQARAVYHIGVEFAPENRELLVAVLAHEPAENAFQRAAIMERLLAVESEDLAGDLTRELIGVRTELEDRDGILRALELGNRATPADQDIRDRLEALYRADDRFADLAEFLERDSVNLEAEEAVARIRESAALYRDTLEDPRRAAEVLEAARNLRPDDAELAVEMAETQRRASDLTGAINTLAAALSSRAEGPERVELLLRRSEVLFAKRDWDRALTDLEEVYRLDPGERSAEALIAGLRRRADVAREEGNPAAERQATMRLASLLSGHGSDEGARELLIGWVERTPGDRQALSLLRDLDAAAERWDGVVLACEQLVDVLTAADQLEAAEQLADAADHVGDPSLARKGLERALADQPTSEPVRARLRSLYDRTGAYRELAELLLSDAEVAPNDDVRYGRLRHAADVFVNDLGDPQSALEPASKARQLRPDDHETVVLFADVLVASGQYQEARAMLEPSIAAHKRRSPELAQLQHRMGRLHGAMGDKPGQLAWIKKAFDVDRKSGPIAADLAHLATEMQEYDLALKPLRAITLMDNPTPVSRVMALLWEAKIEQARGNTRKAEMWAKKALREDPSFSEAQEFLSQITS